MKKKILFVLKSLALFGLVLFFSVHIIMPALPNGYMAAFIDKLERANSISSSKIILMGGSSVAFGIRSDMLEKSLEMPVVNMGLHAGLGQTFCMDLAKKVICEGDIIIIMPEAYDYIDGVVDGTLAWLILDNDLTLLADVRPTDYKSLIEGFPAYLKRACMYWTKETGKKVDARKDYNEYGDNISGREAGNIMEGGYISSEFFRVAVNNELMAYYNNYSQYVQGQGAIMVMASMPIIEPLVAGHEDEAELRQEKVEELAEFPVISEWEDYVYPVEYFYDTNYHLNGVGSLLRTQQLIDDIKRWMEDEDI